MHKEFHFEEGEVILIDKPLEWTSFDVVNKLRRALKIKKVGHAGTLDPLATGLLILCTGKFTKKINEYQGMEKEYTGTITFGKSTPSYDLETDFDQKFEINHIDKTLITKTIKEQFLGPIQQLPPSYSALKVDGKRAYHSARKGKTVKLEPREVRIDLFEITDIALPTVSFKIVCSKGTYIRSIAHDLGKSMNSGAHLSSLRRTKIGDFDVVNAVAPDAFIDKIKSEESI